MTGIAILAIANGESSSSAHATGDPVIAAAGDIACDPAYGEFHGGLGSLTGCRQRYTSDLLTNAGLTAVLALGDTQYYCGGYQAFLQSYDASWGRVRSITRPVIGNHEWTTPEEAATTNNVTATDCDSTGKATGYFDYFNGVGNQTGAAGDRATGYYSFDIGSWHLIALNSSCSHVGGCSAGSPQEKWLQADLAAHPSSCTLAYWHHPRFSSGEHQSDAKYQPFWQDLYDAGADLVLVGHDHDYERFAPQAPSGIADPERGIREFVVGTGGKSLRVISTVAANSEVRNGDTYGVLKLTLHPGSYDWKFEPEAGKTFTDAGSGTCHRAPARLAPARGAGEQPPPADSPTGSTSSPASSMASGSRRFVFTSIGDTYVKSTARARSYGTSRWLRIRRGTRPGDTVWRSYLKFRVKGLTGTVTAVKLRLKVIGATGGKTAVFGTTNDWRESTLTWVRAVGIPRWGINAVDNVGQGTIEVDLGRTAITRDGTYSFGLASRGSGSAASYSSGDSDDPPRLVVTTTTSPAAHSEGRH